MFTVRGVDERDTEALLRLYLALDAESALVMVEPGERSTSVEAMRLRVLQTEVCCEGSLLVAEADGDLLGLVEASAGQFRRTRHVATLTLGVLRSWWGRGVGRALLGAAERWAGEHGVHRLELTAVADNEGAMAFYQKAGYEVESTRRHSLRLGGQWVDQLSLVKLLA